MLGTESGQKKFQISVGYRQSYSDKLFDNARVNQPLTNLLRPKEWLNSVDLTGSYSLNDRVSFSASVPLVLNRISFLIPPGSGGRYGLPGAGIGDLTVLARSFLLNPKKHPSANVALGVGLKVPTGNPGPDAFYPNVQGVFARKSILPNSIAPGDGGTGPILEAIAFKTFNGQHLLKGSNVLLTANYLVNPRNTNGVASAITSLGLAGQADSRALTNTVADSYSLKATLSTPVPGSQRFSGLKRIRLLGSYRWEGIPTRDLIGGNSGFRQPGYVMSIAPGVNLRVYGRYRLTVEVPITINGRINANPQIQPGGPLRRFGFIAPVTVLARVTTSI